MKLRSAYVIDHGRMSFQQYSKYKDTGIKPIERMPAHWERLPLRRIASITYGIGEPPPYHEEGTPLVRATNLHAGVVSFHGVARVDPTEIPERRAVWLSPGDIIVVRSGAYTGDSGTICTVHCPCLAGFDMVVRAHGCNSGYLQYALLSHYLKNHQIDVEKLRAAQPHLNAEELGNCALLLPPLEEQVAIVSFLDRETTKIDALVAAQEDLIALLTEKRQAVISHAVTKGLEPDAQMKPSGMEWLGDVPSRWNVTRLKFVARVQTGVAKGKDYGDQRCVSVPYLRVANVQDGYLDLDDVSTIEIPEADLSRYRLLPGDVLMNEGGDFDKLGRGHVWRGEIEVCIHQNHVFAVRPTAICSDWLSAATGSDYAQFYFMTRAKQSTNLASISSSNLMELPVLVPDDDEQKDILSFIDETSRKFDGLVVEAQRTISLLKERRSAVISAAVTGQIDVRGI